jgi:hypothetical protein
LSETGIGYSSLQSQSGGSKGESLLEAPCGSAEYMHVRRDALDTLQGLILAGDALWNATIEDVAVRGVLWQRRSTSSYGWKASLVMTLGRTMSEIPTLAPVWFRCLSPPPEIGDNKPRGRPHRVKSGADVAGEDGDEIRNQVSRLSPNIHLEGMMPNSTAATEMKNSVMPKMRTRHPPSSD